MKWPMDWYRWLGTSVRQGPHMHWSMFLLFFLVHLRTETYLKSTRLKLCKIKDKNDLRLMNNAWGYSRVNSSKFYIQCNIGFWLSETHNNGCKKKWGHLLMFHSNQAGEAKASTLRTSHIGNIWQPYTKSVPCKQWSSTLASMKWNEIQFTTTNGNSYNCWLCAN